MRRSLLLLLASFPVVALAQSPDNYTCERAFEIPVSSTNLASFVYVNGNVFPSLPPVPATTCSGTLNRRTGWYKFMAVATTHWVRTEGPETDARILEVLGGTCGSLTSLQCFDGLFTLQGQPYQALSGLTIGSVYFIRAMNSSLGCDEYVNCTMGLAVVSAAPNNECASATQVTSLPAAPVARPMTEMATIGATASLPACAGPAADSDDDVWYRFTATAATQHFVYDLLYGVEPTIQWYSGTCGALTSLGCNASKVTGLTPGQEYHIRLHSEGTDHTLRLLGDVCESASNDECSGAIPIVVALTGEEPEAVAITTRTGTSSTVPCDVQASDVWYSFVAPTAGITITSTNNEAAAIYSGACGSLVCLDDGALNSPWNVTGLTPGTSYFLKLGEDITLRESTIRVMAQPSNDECSDAIGLNVLPYHSGQGFVHGHTGGAATGVPACTNAQPRDVWYAFTATAAQHFINLERTLTGSTMECQVLSGSCGSLTSIICEESGAFPLKVTGLTPGTDYFVRVYSNSNNTTAFRIGITEGLVHDDCSGAVPLPVLSPEAVGAHPKTYIARASASNLGTCAPLVKDLWYTFTATDDEAVFVAAYQQYGTTEYVELFSGTCGSLTSVACTNNWRAAFTGLTIGTTYYVRYASNLEMEFVPHIAAVPANDGITGALVAPFGSSSTGPLHNGSSYGATLSYPQFCTQANPDDDTWYRFTATATAHTVRAVQRNTLFAEPAVFGNQMYVEVYDTLSTIADTLEAHMISCGIAPRSLTGLQIGHDYWYRVYTPGIAPAELCLFGTWVQDQDNDEADGAVALVYSDAYSHYFTTSGATQSLPGADCSTDDTADDDIWFRFTATNQPARIVVGHGTADLALEIFSGTPGNLTSMACSDNILVLPALTSGQEYYVRLYSWLNSTPVEGRIGLFATPSLTANDCVDEACLGPVLLANPSIEQGAYCQGGVPNILDVAGLGTPLAPGWPRLHGGSSDGYSSCMPHNMRGEAPAQITVVTLNRNLPRSGKGMAGALALETEGYREYIQAPLSEPLIPGEPYLVSFNAVLSEGSPVKVNGLGALLTVGPMIEGSYGPFDAEPQVVTYDMVEKGAWTNICGIVVPDAAYDNITIGSFFPDRASYTHEGTISNFSSSYHFYDDVVVARVTDPGCITSIGDVPPLEESTSERDALRVYPNPANALLNIVADASLFGQRAVIEVFDATGSRVHAEQVNYFAALQPLDLSRVCKDGLYLVMVHAEGQAPKAARVVVKR
jgi:Secretion system C-terminal sorting domain